MVECLQDQIERAPFKKICNIKKSLGKLDLECTESAHFLHFCGPEPRSQLVPAAMATHGEKWNSHQGGFLVQKSSHFSQFWLNLIAKRAEISEICRNAHMLQLSADTKHIAKCFSQHVWSWVSIASFIEVETCNQFVRGQAVTRALYSYEHTRSGVLCGK